MADQVVVDQHDIAVTPREGDREFALHRHDRLDLLDRYRGAVAIGRYQRPWCAVFVRFRESLMKLRIGARRVGERGELVEPDLLARMRMGDNPGNGIRGLKGAIVAPLGLKSERAARCFEIC